MLVHKEAKKDPHRTTKIKRFTNKYNWEVIHFPSKQDNWKKIEKNNVTININILYAKKEKKYPTYVSKHNSTCKKHVNYGIILWSKNF